MYFPRFEVNTCLDLCSVGDTLTNGIQYTSVQVKLDHYGYALREPIRLVVKDSR